MEISWLVCAYTSFSTAVDSFLIIFERSLNLNVFQFYGMVKSGAYSCSVHELLVNWMFVYVFQGAKLTTGLGGTPYGVARIVIHPMYVPSSPAFYHDIALIRLTPGVINAPHVCLPVPGAPILSPRCIVAGE